MPTKFFTNQDDNSLLKKFEGVFTYLPGIHHFDALVGYFRASGYFKVRTFLNLIPHSRIRILVGINVDQLIKKYHDRGQLYLANPEETKADFLADVLRNIQEADYDEETEKGILQFIDDLSTGKIEMRAHPKKKIHAKVYIFRPENFNEHAPCEVITGSSNLTDAGLGAHPESNYEFNVSLRDFADVSFATEEFERLWSESVPILPADAKAMREKGHLRQSGFTPFELYIKSLIEYFGKRVEYDPYNIDLLLPDKFMRLKYQSDAANQGYAILMKHNGFILADVVGLGKTIIACMVIKKFIYENGTHSKILIVVPPALEANWQRTTEDFQIKNHFEFITIGSLEKILDENNYNYSNADKFDLIVVDESHKFRNDYTNMYGALQEICKRPRSRPSGNGDIRKKVILISATPLNNKPKDIENQLYLFQDKRNSTLENIRNLQDYFKPLNEQYEKLAAEKILDIEKLKALFQKLRDDVVEPLVIRRTRTDIENNQEYLDDLHRQKIQFPKVDDPISVYYQLDGPLASLFFDTVSLITGLDENGNETDGLGYYRYRAIEFLSNEQDKKIYGNVSSISSRLSAIMKTLLIKRLESSFFAFTQSIVRFQKAIDNMLLMFDRDTIFIAPDLDINKLLEEGLSYDQIEAKINEKEGNNKVFQKSAFTENFIALLQSDKVKVDNLVARWGKVTNDPKLDAFSRELKGEFFYSKEHNPSGKLVIFSESKETAAQLSNHIIANSNYRVLSVSADNRSSLEQTIRENFDANLEEEKRKNEFDILLTTEVLAEGINLHRSNLIVNYDVPWNATRLMQRIGRVNRIGSQAAQIFVYNFYPSAHGDAQINLVNNALRKLQSFHTAFGEDNKIFSLLEEKGEGALFGNKIQREESEILVYLHELRDFKKKHPERFAEIAKIPNKASCGRHTADRSLTLVTAENDPITYPLKHTSLTYLKSENHPGVFCLITPNHTVIELNFLQAIKLFKADEKEKAASRHEFHYTQTARGLDFFKSHKNQENIQPVARNTLSPTERTAIANINAILKVVPTEQKRLALLQVRQLITNGTYVAQGLPTSINTFFRDNAQFLITKPTEFVNSLFANLLDGYNLLATGNAEEEKQTGQGIVNPKIVLTQSFI